MSTGEITSLTALRPGDIMFGPIGGAVGLGVGLGQLALGEAFRIGRLSIRHVGVVVEAGQVLPFDLPRGPRATWGADGHRYEIPKLVQAMPRGAEEIEMTEEKHWTPRHAYVRLPEDYPGQAEDAAAIAWLMVAEGVDYSFASYAALAAWRWGWKTPRLERWINRRRAPVPVERHEPLHGVIGGYPETYQGSVQLPCEAICSVLADQAWSLTGKKIMEGVPHQVVTPGALASRLWRMPGASWGGAGLL